MVASAIKTSKKFLFSTQNTIISAAFIIAVTYAASAFLGLIRARMLAHYFGATDVLGVFYTADRIPSLIYSVLVAGTLSTIFIPVFTETLKKDKEAAWEVASSILGFCLVVFLTISLFLFIYAGKVIAGLSLGKFTSEEVLLGSSLLRIMLIAQVILVVSSFFSSVLQSLRFFLIPALSPVFYNLGMILGLVYFYKSYGIYAPALGVVLGALLHMFIQLPLLRKVNFRFRFVPNLFSTYVKDYTGLFLPRIFGSLLVQVSFLISNSLAILVSTSSVVIFKFANQLEAFPVLLFGSSIAAAALPTLSFESGEKDKEKFKNTFVTSLHQMLFLVIPASVIFLVLRVPVIRLIYGVANFSWDATIQTSYTLAFFSLSMFSQSSLYLLNRAFFALKDTATPLKVNAMSVLFGSVAAFVLIKYFELGVWSLAFTYSVASILEFFVLTYLLDKKVGGFGYERLVKPFVKISYSAVFMGMSLYIPMKLLDIAVFDTTKTLSLLMLTAIAGIAGMVSYLLFTWLLKVEEIALLYKLLGKLSLRPAIQNHPPTSASEQA